MSTAWICEMTDELIHIGTVFKEDKLLTIKNKRRQDKYKAVRLGFLINEKPALPHILIMHLRYLFTVFYPHPCASYVLCHRNLLPSFKIIILDLNVLF